MSRRPRPSYNVAVAISIAWPVLNLVSMGIYQLQRPGLDTPLGLAATITAGVFLGGTISGLFLVFMIRLLRSRLIGALMVAGYALVTLFAWTGAGQGLEGSDFDRFNPVPALYYGVFFAIAMSIGTLAGLSVGVVVTGVIRGIGFLGRRMGT